MRWWVPCVLVLALGGFVVTSRVQLGQQADGSFLISTGQRIELLGKTVRLEGARSKDLALSPDHQRIAVLAHGRLLIAKLTGDELSETAIAAAPLGVAWSPDGKFVYCSLSSGKIGKFLISESNITKTGQLDVVASSEKRAPGTTGLAVDSKGNIFAALSIRNEVIELNSDGKIESTWNVGASPYNLVLSPNEQILAVANRGGMIVSPNPLQGDPTTRQAFDGTGVANALSAGTPVQIDPRTDAALGGSVSLIPVGTTKTGAKAIQVGRQPAGMVFTNDGKKLYIADSDEDAVSEIDTLSQTEARRFSITPKEDPGFGQIPTSLALSPTNDKLFVALGGANAVAVIDMAKSPRVLGYFPTAWYPIALQADASELFVACSKGIGSRPSAKTTGFNVHDSVGAYQIFKYSEMADLPNLTKHVAKNNLWSTTLTARKNRKAVPLPDRLGEPSVFKHVVYIIKENLSYDTAMGDIKTGNGDPSLCTFPLNVTPNHHELANRFGLLDNFYISGTNSADGHQWVDSAIANDYTERNYGASQRSYPYDGGDPLAFSPAGFLWSQAKAAGRSVRVFGEFVDKPTITDSLTGKTPDWKRCWADYKSGKGEIVVKAGTSQAQLRENLDPTYIGFPVTITDQWRADHYIKQLNDWESNNSMPNLSILLLPNDHTGGTRPGWPTPRAEVADNDFALGRLVEAISKSKFWPETLIIVAEDDSQNGQDHVDGHRSICFCISAYSRPGTTNSDIYNHVSIAATIGRVLGMPPMTRFDRTIKPMYGCFGEKPDLTPFSAVLNQVPLDELNPPAKKNLTLASRKLAEACELMDWDEPDTQDQQILNRAIWDREAPRSVGMAGYPTSYPPSRKPR